MDLIYFMNTGSGSEVSQTSYTTTSRSISTIKERRGHRSGHVITGATKMTVSRKNF